MTGTEILILIKSPEIIAALLTIFIGIILQPRSRIIWGASHQFCFTLPRDNGPVLVHSRTIFIKNMGRALAKDVEVHFGYKPEHYEVWPVLSYTTTNNPPDNAGGNFVIRIPYLAKREYVTIELLQSNQEPPFLLKIRTADGEGKAVSMTPQQVFPNWFNMLAVGIFLLGIYQIIKWILEILL